MRTSHVSHEMLGHPNGNKTITVDGSHHLPVGTVCEIHHTDDGSESYNFSIPGSPGHEDGRCLHDQRHRYVMEADDRFHYLPSL